MSEVESERIYNRVSNRTPITKPKRRTTNEQMDRNKSRRKKYDPTEGMNPNQKLAYDDVINWLGNISPRIYALVERFDYAKLGMKTTVCTVILKTGYEITNYSVPVLQEDFNAELAQIIAKKRAIESLLELDRYISL